MRGDYARRMSARVDHLVVPVRSVPQAVRRWARAGLAAEVATSGPGTAAYAVVRGPGHARVELCEGRGQQVSWGIAVDDVLAARAAAVKAGFEAGPVEGETWSVDGHPSNRLRVDLRDPRGEAEPPGLVEWVTPPLPGAADGPVVETLILGHGGRDHVIALLQALGLPTMPTFLSTAFHDGQVGVALLPTEAEVEAWRRDAEARGAAFFSSGTWDGPDGALESVEVTVWHEPRQARLTLDGLTVSVHTDDRIHPGHVLLPDVEARFARRDPDLRLWDDPHPDRDPDEAEYSRCLDPGKYRIIAVRVRAWADALAAAGHASLEEESSLLRIVPVVVGEPSVEARFDGFDGVEDNMVTLGVAGADGELMPDCGCDACDSGSADLLEQVDRVFLEWSGWLG